ncbi:MAG: DMT family transporter [Angustibacter sp.]
MKRKSSATLQELAAIPSLATGVTWGLVGVVAFSFTVPFTRVAVDGLNPLFIGAGRATIAALLAGAALALTRQPIPSGNQWARLAVVAGGIVVGFPLLTSFALTTASASHGAVVIALLPMATAMAAATRGKERPGASFWLLAIVGAVAAVGFACVQGGGFAQPTLADLLLFGAVIAGAIGYAEGGLLARELGAWQTVSWALVIAAPLTTAVAIATVVDQLPTATPAQWAAFGYLAAVSMFLGFFAWYRGLAIGPMTQVSQVQLVQPVLSILWAALLLREQLTWSTALGGLAVILCAGTAVRTRLNRTASRSSAPIPDLVPDPTPAPSLASAPNRSPDPAPMPR